MEQKQTDTHLKAILNSPARFTPAVPTPDWSAPASVPSTSTASSSTQQQRPTTSNVVQTTPSVPVNEPPNHTITIQNCVTTVDLCTRLDLTVVNARTRNSEYNPSRFHGLIMRLREPRTTALIFQTGKIVCTGAKSEQDALLASKKFARIVQKLGFEIKFENFKIQNLVATCDLKFPIKLENLALVHGQFCSYEPELFPGIIYRMIKPRLCLLIFVNGKIVFTGSKSRQDIQESLDNIYPILRSYKK